jgi:hypothetical protein
MMHYLASILYPLADKSAASLQSIRGQTLT